MPSVVPGRGLDLDVRHKRVNTGDVSGASTADVTVTWGTPFGDTNYTVVAQMRENQDGESLRVMRVKSVAMTGVTVRVINNALGSRSGEVHAIAIHD